MRKKIVFCLIGLLFLCRFASFGKKIYTTKRISAPPHIDGELNDTCWSQGKWEGGFIQREPVSEVPATEKTEFKIFYDDKNIYVGIRAYESEPDKIDKRIARRDSWVGDIVGAAFDTFYDQRNAFEFDLTAGGVKIDAVAMNNATSWNMDWDPVWEGKTFFEDSAWTAELRIPFSQVRYPSDDEQVWGLHVVRYIHRKQEEDDWTNIPRTANGMAHLYGELRGLKGLKRKRRIEILPFAAMEYETFKKDESNPFYDGAEKKTRFGLDGKIGITSGYTMDFTINPDFGQVEADPASINLTSFETFFQEKRPFFIEGKNIFDFSIDNDILFYSRRIGNKPAFSPPHDYMDSPEQTTILSAEKITGKNGKGFSMGLMHALTKEEKASIYSNHEETRQTVKPLSNYIVIRGKQELDRGNAIVGGMITSSMRSVHDDDIRILDKNAYAGGMDFLRQWNDKNYYAEGKWIFSHISGDSLAISSLMLSPVHNYQRPDADHLEFDPSKKKLNGWGGSWEIGKGGGFWRFSERYSHRSAGLELNDVGYLKQADIRENTFRLGFNETKKTRFFNSYSLYVADSHVFAGNGKNIDNTFKVEFNSTLINHCPVNLVFSKLYDRLDTRELRGGPRIRKTGYSEIYLYAGSDRRKKSSFALSFTKAQFDEKDFSYFNITGESDWILSNQLKFSLNMTYEDNRDNQQYIRTLVDSDEALYLFGKLDQKTFGLTFRLDLNINRELTIQYYGNPFVSAGDYNAYKYVNLPAAEQEKERFSYFTEVLEHDNQVVVKKGSDMNAFHNPDFNYKSFHSNLVVRWEYRTGSTLFFVWSMRREDFERQGCFKFSDDMDRLFHSYPKSVFMLKFTRWFMI